MNKQKIDEKAYDILQRLMKEFMGESEEPDLPDVRLVVHLVHENGNGETLDMPVDEDSAGTSKIVENIVELFFLSKDGGLILEDELGKVYHAKLPQHVLETMKSECINTGNVQFLFTSHDTKILNMLNHDQIYLIDKAQDGSTYVKLLDDFQIRGTENIELGYLKGRYESIPYMKG